MKAYLVALFIVAIFLFQPLKANACVCENGAPCTSFADSSAVFIGKVIQGSETVDIRQETPNTKTYVAGIVRFTVEETFKGTLGAEVRVSVASNIGTSCGPYALAQGEKYLVYAYGDSANLSTGVCTRTTKLAKANEDLEFLRNLPPAGSGGRLAGSIWADTGERRTTPLSGVTVIIRNVETQAIQQVVTNKEGIFELTNLKAGKYVVEPVFPKYYESEHP